MQATITNTHMDRNLFGLKVNDGGQVVVYNSTAASNANNGFIALASSGFEQVFLQVVHSLTSGNGVAGIATSGSLALVDIFDVTSVNNGQPTLTASGGTFRTTSPATSYLEGSGFINGGGVNLQ